VKEEKKRKNQLEIQSYELQREKDLLTAMLEQIRTIHPEVQFQLEENSLPLIENYLTKIQQLQAELLDREKVNNQLQIEYTRIRECADRDEQILIKKNDTIYNLAKENKDLKRAITELKREIYRISNVPEGEGEEEEEGMPTIHEALEEEESLEADEQFKEEAKEFSANEETLKTELKKVEGAIEEKESMLSRMAGEQMELEYRLIEEMKEEYHQKITELEKQKTVLIKQQRADSSHNSGKHAVKMEGL
jgi:hypothetical protein